MRIIRLQGSRRPLGPQSLTPFTNMWTAIPGLKASRFPRRNEDVRSKMPLLGIELRTAEVKYCINIYSSSVRRFDLSRPPT